MLHTTSSKRLFEAKANELFHLIWAHEQQRRQQRRLSQRSSSRLRGAPCHPVPRSTLFARLGVSAHLSVPVGPATPPGCDDGCVGAKQGRTGGGAFCPVIPGRSRVLRGDSFKQAALCPPTGARLGSSSLWGWGHRLQLLGDPSCGQTVPAPGQMG